MVEVTRKKIKNYIVCLDNRLGSGNFGQVFKSYSQDDISQIFAIKQISRSKVPESKMVNFLLDLGREITTMMKLSHDNILKLKDYVCTDNNFYLITEYCEGGYLTNIKSTLKYENILTILKQITKAMLHANSLKIIHRDLKPQNILIHDNIIKIGDFGLARILDDDNKMTPLTGTPAYMAPEIFSLRNYSEKCDMWSTGIMLYELVFRKHPWKEDNAQPLGEYMFFEKKKLLWIFPL